MGKLPPLLASLLCSCLLLAACTSNPPSGDQQTTTAAGSSSQETDPTGIPRNYPVRPFPTQTFYELLIAEFAGARGRVDLALERYLRQARTTQDPNVIGRACKIAGYLDNKPALLEMCPLWARVEPDSIEAHQLAAFALGSAGQLEAAFDEAAYLLGHGVGEPLLALPSYAQKITPTRRAGLIERYLRLQQAFPDSREVQLGTAQLLQQQGDVRGSAQILQDLLTTEPDNEPIRLLLAQMLYHNNQRDEAIAVTAAGLQITPDSKALQLLDIRFLAETDMPQARQRLNDLAAKYPEDADMQFSLALFNRDIGLRAEARSSFERLISHHQRANDAHYQLGTMAEEESQITVALVHYRAVRDGDNFLVAAARTTAILARQNRLTDARIYLHKLRLDNPDQATALYQMESELLLAEKSFQDAYQILTDGLKEHPDSIELLYARSLASEKLRNIASVEQDLRAILERDANNAAALNALGYTLANHTQRYAEARSLIERAMALSPEDPAIIDSLGWVLYREGKHQEAVSQLRRAIALMPDPEIAAHLGEVLWMSGQRDEAKTVWRQALGDAPSNTTLLETLNRLQVDMP